MTRDTPRYGHAPIEMVRREACGAIENAGEFCWKVDADKRRSLVLAIPRNAEGGWVLSSWTIDHKNDCGASWSWNGNEDRPTLTPSLHAVGVWHGWVRDGQIAEA